jgi:hypothetical protein
MLSKEQAEELIVQMSAKGVLFVDGMRKKAILPYNIQYDRRSAYEIYL